MILDDIVKKRKQRYQKIMAKRPIDELKNELAKIKYDDNIRFYDLFNNKDFIYICECKKASPSKGIIKEDFNYLQIAKEYENAGANVISCLTEPDFFLGSDEYLINIKNNVNIPVLRKDFIFSEYQIYESKLIGADLILLIVAILSEEQLTSYINLAHKLKLGVLVETHSEEEIKLAIKCGAKVIGVNNRNLKNFSVDNTLSIRLKEKYSDVILISESGVKTKDDVKNIKRAKLNGVLIGEALMRSDNITKMLEGFINEG